MEGGFYGRKIHGDVHLNHHAKLLFGALSGHTSTYTKHPPRLPFLIFIQKEKERESFFVSEIPSAGTNCTHAFMAAAAASLQHPCSPPKKIILYIDVHTKLRVYASVISTVRTAV